MYTTLDTDSILRLAHQHQAEVKRAFPRRFRKSEPGPSVPTIIAAPMARIDVGALSIPAPRQHDREKTVA
jgi:hypothetical protein